MKKIFFFLIIAFFDFSCSSKKEYDAVMQQHIVMRDKLNNLAIHYRLFIKHLSFMEEYYLDKFAKEKEEKKENISYSAIYWSWKGHIKRLEFYEDNMKAALKKFKEEYDIFYNKQKSITDSIKTPDLKKLEEGTYGALKRQFNKNIGIANRTFQRLDTVRQMGRDMEKIFANAGMRNRPKNARVSVHRYFKKVNVAKDSLEIFIHNMDKFFNFRNPVGTLIENEKTKISPQLKKMREQVNKEDKQEKSKSQNKKDTTNNQNKE
jgi:predicted DNA-binding protein YlxM (UPF0122 family)